MFKTVNLSFKYNVDGDSVLEDINLDIADGSFTVILGHNGSGKSTLAKNFNAFLLPTEGKVFVDGMDTSDDANLNSIRQTAGMVFQNPDNQIVAAIVEDDVAFGPENLGIPTNEIRQRVDDALKTVDMYEFKDHAPHLLSGGQKQRVSIAGIIAMRPRAIIFDEPTAMLDPKGRHEVISTILKLNSEYGITVVLITHHMSEAILADRVIVINKGKIISDGIPSEIFTHVDELRSVGLEVPASVSLLYELNKRGYSFDLHNISPEACADVILRETAIKAED